MQELNLILNYFLYNNYREGAQEMFQLGSSTACLSEHRALKILLPQPDTFSVAFS